jgi:hypothetical protein
MAQNDERASYFRRENERRAFEIMTELAVPNWPLAMAVVKLVGRDLERATTNILPRSYWRARVTRHYRLANVVELDAHRREAR